MRPRAAAMCALIGMADRFSNTAEPPAVPYHTPIRGSLSTPGTIPLSGERAIYYQQILLPTDWLRFDTIQLAIGLRQH